MKPGTRMMMLSSLGDNERRIGFRSGGEEMRGGWENDGGYGAQNRYDERMPRSGYDPQNAGPWNGDEGWEPESNRERSGGMWRGEEMRSRRNRADTRNDSRQNYGYAQRPQSHYGSEEDGDEMSGTFRHRKDQGRVSEEGEKLTEERVKKWVESMKDDSGRNGPRFTMEQAELQRSNHCMQCDKLEFYAAINMMYSDYCEVARRMNVDKTEFYALMAKAFLLDKDAAEGKLAKYMKYVAEK